MCSCAGTCEYQQGAAIIKLSEPLLKVREVARTALHPALVSLCSDVVGCLQFRPAIELKETLLHEVCTL